MAGLCHFRVRVVCNGSPLALLPPEQESMMNTMRERMSRVIAEQFNLAENRVTETATLDDDLGATSLDRVELVMTLEEEFAIDISDDQASRLNTVGDVLACVAARVGRAPTLPESRVLPPL
jgi:acyl carrier protein